MSQTTDILAMLKSNPEGITPLDALRWCGSLRLAARISELRREGHRIETVIERTPNGSNVARYRLA